MVLGNLGEIKKYAKPLVKGLEIEFAPMIAKGVVSEIMAAENIDVKKLSDWVIRNVSLWDNLSSNYKEYLKRMGTELGDLSWMTTEWLIDSLRDTHPGLASLFLSWKKSRNWLTRQIEIIKKEATE